VPTTNDDSQVFYNAGVGVKFGLTDRVNLVTEVKGIHKVENDDDDIIGTVGVGVKLGTIEKSRPKCDNSQAMSLNEFAKMCKTAPQAAPMPAPAQKLQSEPQVVQQSEVVEQAPVEEVVDEKVKCVVDVQAPETAVETSESANIPEGFYVQMAALFKGNGEMLTSRLERKKYPYVLYNTERFGKEATLVLVGPYESRKEAAVALRYLKRLSAKAFVKRFP
jgi:cell division septation protein DedD